MRVCSDVRILVLELLRNEFVSKFMGMTAPNALLEQFVLETWLARGNDMNAAIAKDDELNAAFDDIMSGVSSG